MTGLSELFHDLADEAKSYDVTEGALRGAKRRRRARLAVMPVAAVVTVMVAVAVRPGSVPAPLVSPSVSATASPVVAFPKACVPQVLPLPSGFRYATVTGGDPSGRRLLGVLDPGAAGERPVMWVDGVPQLLTLPGIGPVLLDMNEAGVAVGVTKRGTPPMHITAGFVYDNGKVSMLRGEASRASSINGSGVIAGAIEGRPVLWRDAGAEPQPQPMPDTVFFGTVHEIDDDNTIIGEWVTNLLPPVSYIWYPDGTAVKLPDGQWQWSIRNGWAAGSVDGKAWRWNVSAGVSEQLAGQLDGHTALVNSRGWVLGTTGDGRVQLASATQFVTLPLPPDTAAGRRDVELLSDDGRIAAGWLTGPIEDQVGPQIKATPVMWRCS